MLKITILLASVTLIILTYLIPDMIITNKRLKMNQKEWDEYSKNMNQQEKIEHYLDWCKLSKAKHEWNYYYFPRM